MGLSCLRIVSLLTVVFGGLGTIVAAGIAQPLTPPRPPIGGFGSPPDAMIFYVAHGAAGTCGPGCSEWIAAEGTVQWDTHKRDRQQPAGTQRIRGAT